VIHTWLDLPIALIFLVLAVLYGMTGAAIYWVMFGSPLRRRVHSLSGIVGPYFGAIGILFALLTGFLGAEVADRNKQAARSVLAEASALDTLASLSRAAGPEGAAIRTAARGYIEAVINKEWAAMSTSGSSPAAFAALGAMLEAVAKPGIGAAAGAPLQASLLNAAVRIASARAERLSFAADRSYELKWISVLLLGILTQIALGLVHLDKPRAMLAAVALFSIAAIVALGLIAAQENPFEPPLEISNAPLVRALAMLPAEP
jgi:hypothetical protein